MKLAQRIVLGYYRLKFKLLELISPKIAAKEAFELFCTPYSRKRKSEAPEAFKMAEKVSLSVHNNTVQGFKWVPEQTKGIKILIVHGFDSRSYRFDKYIEPLVNEGLEVFAFDAPGHGLSSGKTINALLYRDMILKAIEDHGPFDGIMAHSFGGIAVSLAIEELQSNLPKRLILIAPSTETTRSVTDFSPFLHLSKKLKNELENLILEISKYPVSWFSVARVIQKATVRTLWIHDLKDNITPYEDMKHLRELNLPHVEFLITEGLGHSLYREDEIVDKIIMFLKELTI